MQLIQWCRPDEQWRCYCGAELRLTWVISQVLYDTHEAITPEYPNTSSWELVCTEGHTLLLCHEMADDQSADTYEAPTTDDVAQRLASVDDLAAWRAYVERARLLGKSALLAEHRKAVGEKAIAEALGADG